MPLGIDALPLRANASRLPVDVAADDAARNAGATQPDKPSFELRDVTPDYAGAASKTAEGTYLSGDGTAFAYFTFTLPPKPTDSTKQFLMYKVSTDSQWLVAAGPFVNDTNLTGVTVRDLTPGMTYAFSIIAFSGLDLATTPTDATSSPFLAPGDTTVPSAPGAGSFTAGNTTSAIGRPAPRLIGSPSVQALAATVHWGISASKDVEYYDLVATTTDTDAAAQLQYDFDGPLHRYAGRNTLYGFMYYPSATPPTNLYIRMLAVDYTGNQSTWRRIGDVITYLQLPVGSMIEQNASAVAITGGTAAAVTLSNVTLNSVATGTESTARAALALGNIATQAKTAVDIDGGDVQGLSRLSTGNFFANDTASGISGGGTAVDVKDVNFRIYSGATQKARIDYSNGDYITQGALVNARLSNDRFEFKVNGANLEVYVNGTLFLTL